MAAAGSKVEPAYRYERPKEALTIKACGKLTAASMSGQSEEDATAHLDAMNKGDARGKTHPWTLSFSYGRALQTSCLKAWLGNESNVAAAQAALLRVFDSNSKASLGRC